MCMQAVERPYQRYLKNGLEHKVETSEHVEEYIELITMHNMHTTSTSSSATTAVSTNITKTNGINVVFS